MAPSFETLPAELLTFVLQATDSPRDLYRLISASPLCFQLFARTPERFLSYAIKNSLPIESLRVVVAILRVPPDRYTSERMEQVKLLLDECFDKSASFTFPNSKSDLIQICRLNTRLSHMIDGFFMKAMRGFETFDQRVHDPVMHSTQSLQMPAPAKISINEKIRLQRAFLRFELYSKAFPPDNRITGMPVYSAELQSLLFLSHLDPWEMEELTCVHQYFSSVYGEFLAEMEDDVVQAALQAQVPVLPTCRLNQNSGPTQDLSSAGYEIKTVRSFHLLGQTDLHLFSRKNRRAVRFSLNFMASLGLEAIYQFTQSAKLNRMEFIRRNTPRARSFLADALTYTSREEFQATHHEANDSPSYPSYGYSIFRPRCPEMILTITHQFPCYMLRELGYVFWDSWRIFPAPIFDKLNQAKNLNKQTYSRLFDWVTTKSVEERLFGVFVPHSQFHKIEEKFGSIYLRHARGELEESG